MRASLPSVESLGYKNRSDSRRAYMVQPVIPRDCNYYNLDRVKSTSKWDDEKLEWKMPPLFREQVHLPPTGPLNSMPQKGLKGMVQRSQVPSSPPYDPDEEYREDMYLKKLEQKQQQNPADYFQSKRANKLLSGRPQADEPPPGRYQQNGWVTSPTGQWPEEDYGKKSAKPNPLAPTKQSRKW